MLFTLPYRLIPVALCGLAVSSVWGADPVDFEKQIRPILVEHCQSCHGSKKQQASLRLDTRDHAFKGGESGAVIVPGKPADSLLHSVLLADAQKRMPPKAPLTELQIGLIREWLAQGAKWPRETGGLALKSGELWSLRPPRYPSPPKVDAKQEIKDPIDAFILDRIAKAGLEPAPIADKRTLYRRAAFVLTGLPPTPEKVEAFLKDGRPDAWQWALDEMFEGPSHPERWARHWMDVSRYSDTKGYVFFQDGQYPWSWAFRDWVVRAFREDRRFDGFVRAQIAADRLQELGRGPVEDLPALGFLALGGQFMNNPHDIIDDRIDVVSRGLLGLTVTCARCHDHKFDPVSMADYYSLYSIFANSTDPEVPPLFGAPPATPEYEAFRKELVAREQKLEVLIRDKHAQTLTAARDRLAEHLIALQNLRGKPAQDDFMLLSDPNEPNPTLLKRWRVWLDSTPSKTDPVWGLWWRIEGLPSEGFGSSLAGLLEKAAQISEPASRVSKDLIASLVAAKPKNHAEAAKVFAGVVSKQLDTRNPNLPWNTPKNVFSDLELFPDRASQAVLQDLRKKVEQWRIEGKGAPPRAHALVDVADPKVGRLFLRGNPVRPGNEVPRVVPSSLGRGAPIPSGSGRLELADTITHPDHPLLARVWVNRVWQICFGEALVRTPGDFGSRGELATHPELLDYLARSFIEDGWSTRRLIRRILNSATWARSGQVPAGAMDKDPENRLWTHRPPRRSDFESLRDSMLAVSGRLDPTVGGPSSKDMDSTRRTLYLHIDRLQVPSLLRNFDFPSPDATSSRRDQTTTPLQALWVMNHPFGIVCADGLAKKAGDPAKPDLWIGALYKIALQRAPEGPEISSLKEFLAKQGADGPTRAAQAILASNEFSFVD